MITNTVLHWPLVATQRSQSLTMTKADFKMSDTVSMKLVNIHKYSQMMLLHFLHSWNPKLSNTNWHNWPRNPWKPEKPWVRQDLQDPARICKASGSMMHMHETSGCQAPHKNQYKFHYLKLTQMITNANSPGPNTELDAPPSLIAKMACSRMLTHFNHALSATMHRITCYPVSSCFSRGEYYIQQLRSKLFLHSS